MVPPTLLDETTGRSLTVAGDRVLLGRHPRAQLRLLDAGLSLEHAWLGRRGDELTIEPASAAASTLLNGRPLLALTRLAAGDRIEAGGLRLRVVDTTAAPRVAPGVAVATAAVPGTAPGRGDDAPEATVVGHAAARLTLAQREVPIRGNTTLGRSADNDLRLPSVQVSRHHARLEVQPSVTRLVDLGSSNGTFVNGRRVTRPTPLRANDVVTIGPFELLFTGWSLQQSGGGPAGVAAIGVTQAVPDEQRRGHHKTILQPTDVVVQPGEFFVILGESGGGKSTLMNLLSGRAQPAAGRVLLDGRDLCTHFAALRPRIAFVPQKNLLFDELTVLEHLRYTARLRLPADTDAATVEGVVVDTIRLVGLADHAATRCKDLSGGQKKRASLANEILVRPGILFVDEVTSGLDEGTDREIMTLLRDLTRAGVTVVCITHTLRNVASCCDRVCVLAQPGQVLFVGPPAEALQAFEVTDLGGIFDRLKADPSPGARQRLRRRFVDSEVHAREVAAPLQSLPALDESPAPAAQAPDRARRESWRQFRIVLDRVARLLLLDRRTLAIALGQAVLVGLAMAAVFGAVPDDLAHVPTQQTVQFLLAVSCLWFGCSNASKELVKDRDLFRQEADVCLLPGSYLLAKAAVFALLGFVQVALLLGLVITLTGVAGNTAWQAVSLAATVLAGTTLGLCISSFARDRDQANTIVPIVLVPQIIMAGRIADLPSAIEWFAGTFVTSYWSYTGMDAIADERWQRATIAVVATLAQTSVLLLASHLGLARPGLRAIAALPGQLLSRAKDWCAVNRDAGHERQRRS